MMTYEQAIEYVGSFTKSGKPVKDLIRFVILMRSLGNPQCNMKIVHVAGTNGKGSVCEYVSNAIQSSGKTVGKFTSPYINCIEERIQINGKYISKPAFALICEQVRRAIDKSGFDGYSQFEVLCAIGFLYFAKEQVSYAVIETGIGGALDCTNILDPAVSVITSVGYDHTHILGSTISDIAWHKAGIIKPSVPCVIAPEQQREAMEVFDAKCREFNSEEIVPDMSRVQILHMDIGDVFFSYKGMNYHIRMSGKHQIKNAVCAIEACKVLGIGYSNVFTGLEKSVLPARMEVIAKDGVKYIVDGSHNPSAMKAAAELLTLEQAPKCAVIGMLAEKDWQSALPELMPSFEEIVFVDNFIQGSVSAAELARFATMHGVKCKVGAGLSEAIEYAAEKAKDGGYAMITGSLYLAGAARKIIVGE